MAAFGDDLRLANKSLPLCQLPDPQGRISHPPPPGGLPKGLWFEGPSKLKAEIKAEKDEEEAEVSDHEFKQRVVAPAMSPGPRDVRKGEKWLSHHNLIEFNTNSFNKVKNFDTSINDRWSGWRQ